MQRLMPDLAITNHMNYEAILQVCWSLPDPQTPEQSTAFLKSISVICNCDADRGVITSSH